MMFSMIYFVMLETERYGKLRSVFDSRPWRNRENAYLPASSASPVSGAANRCPFSKKLARGVCPHLLLVHIERWFSPWRSKTITRHSRNRDDRVRHGSQSCRGE
jgi:hypothetical protein